MEYKNQMQNAVLEFQKAFNHPVADEPQSITLERGLNRSIWTGEEIVEFLHSLCKDEVEFAHTFLSFMEGLKKAYDKSMKEEFLKTELVRVTAMSDALADQLYFVFGTAVEMGIDIQEIFDIVQASNMSKLFTDEQGNKFAKYREEDGKVLKSPEFFPPESQIMYAVLKQMATDIELE